MKDTQYQPRFIRHKDELEWLFMELYNDRHALRQLEDVMEAGYAARSGELKALDEQRLQDPDWYKRQDMLGMTMYTDLFAGTLNGLLKGCRT